MTAVVVVFAHQGGWDEMLMVAVPIGLFLVLLRVANARALAAEEPEHRDPAEPTGTDPEEPR